MIGGEGTSPISPHCNYIQISDIVESMSRVGAKNALVVVDG